MPQVVIDLSPAEYEAAQNAAASAELPVEVFAAGLLRAGLTTTQKLDWDAEKVLKILQGLGMGPGQPVSFDVLFVRWTRKETAAGPQALWDGLNKLEAAGLVVPSLDARSSVALTPAGYSRR